MPDAITLEHLFHQVGANRNLGFFIAALSLLGVGFAAAALFYARRAFTVSLIVLEKVSQEQTARINTQFRDSMPK